MEEESKTPTIENPFAKEVKKATNLENPFARKDVTKDRRTFIQNRPRPVEEKAKEIFKPNFYISQASQRFIAQQIEKQNLNDDELPLVYKMAFIVGKLFRRPVPTMSDVEVAVKIRTLENARMIAAGEVQLDIIRNEVRGLDVMPRKERLEFWRLVAERVVSDYDAETTTEDPSA
jgi:hypothetical protein